MSTSTKKFGVYTVEPILVDGEVSSFKIKTESENFVLEVDLTTGLGQILSLDYAGLEPLIESWFMSMYLLTQNLPDVEYLSSLAEQYNKLVERWNERQGVTSEIVEDEQEEREAIEDVKVHMYGAAEIENVVDKATSIVANVKEVVDNAKNE